MSAQPDARDYESDTDTTSTVGAPSGVTPSITADGIVYTPSATISGVSETLGRASVLTPSTDTDTQADASLAPPASAAARDAGARTRSIQQWAQGLDMPTGSGLGTENHVLGEWPEDGVDMASIASRATPSSHPNVSTIDITPPGTETVDLSGSRGPDTAASVRLTPEMTQFVEQTKLKRWLSQFTYDPWSGDTKREATVRRVLDPSPWRGYTMSIKLDLPTEQSRKTAASFRRYLKSLPGIDDFEANNIALFGQLHTFRGYGGDPEQPLGPEFDVFSNDLVFDLRSYSPDQFDDTIDMWRENQRQTRIGQFVTGLIVDVRMGKLETFEAYVASNPGPEV